MKVKLRSSSESRSIEQHWRMRDARRGAIYQVKEVDAVTDRAWVYLVVERGVAA